MSPGQSLFTKCCPAAWQQHRLGCLFLILDFLFSLHTLFPCTESSLQKCKLEHQWKILPACIQGENGRMNCIAKGVWLFFQNKSKKLLFSFNFTNDFQYLKENVILSMLYMQRSFYPLSSLCKTFCLFGFKETSFLLSWSRQTKCLWLCVFLLKYKERA